MLYSYLASNDVKSAQPMNTSIRKLPKAPNLTEMTYLSIKESVLTGSLEPSFRLTEELLANQLGISKSPVREALNRLEAEGFIHIEPRGASVRNFTAKEIADLYNLRVVLELHSIAAADVTPEVLGNLANSIERTEKILLRGDRLAHIEEDIRFHRILSEATGNGELCRVFENVQQKTLLCRYKSYMLSATTSPVAHKRIYQALLHKDIPAAQLAMQEHITFVRDRLLRDFETRNSPVPRTAVA
jgi:DNA-binding GntR family transcriptional regulator